MKEMPATGTAPEANFDSVAKRSNIWNCVSTDADVQPVRPTTQNDSWPILLVILLAVAASWVIRVFDIDQYVASLVYDSANRVWPFERAHPWLWFYRNGTLPPMVIGIAGFILAICPLAWAPKSLNANWHETRRKGLFLFLVLLIGPGLLVEGAFKTGWGRPRPLQCREFDGDRDFVPVGQWGATSFPNSSFPSGHAASAFFMMVPAFVIASSRSRLRLTIFAVGIGYGLAMGFTRVIQGGHFVSDVLWAGVIVYLVSVVFSRLILDESTRLV
jgi:membrane-associated PAP2 superfamily phosphatase